MSDFTLGEHSARLDNIEASLSGLHAKVDQLVTADVGRRSVWRFATGLGAEVGALAATVINWLGVRGSGS